MLVDAPSFAVRGTDPGHRRLADALSLRGPAMPHRSDDLSHITRDWELHYWADRWGVPVCEVRRAMDRAGPRVADVARCLNGLRVRQTDGLSAPASDPRNRLRS